VTWPVADKNLYWSKNFRFFFVEGLGGQVRDQFATHEVCSISEGLFFTADDDSIIDTCSLFYFEPKDIQGSCDMCVGSRHFGLGLERPYTEYKILGAYQLSG